MEPHVLTFDSPVACLATVGGKGANLAKLIRSGYSVPSGFFVTTAAYREFVRVNAIATPLLRLVRSVTSNDPVALENISDEIRALFSHGRIPDEVSNAIIIAWAELSAAVTAETGPGASARSYVVGPAVVWPIGVAVRSSATAEDLPDLSFAGQQESYLNIIGAEAVCDAVKACWSSLWTARAIVYRARHQISHDDLALAVVVQQMICSESAGVLFTANPLTGNRQEMVIDASLGLGESVVAGQVDPDHYVVDTTRWRIASIRLGTKEISVLPRPGGGTQTVPQNNAERQALPDDEILSLAQIARRVADEFGSPQDIEWAWANGRMHLLQARPITSLYPLPPDSHRQYGLRAYVNVSALQGMMDPLTPVGYDVLRMFAQGLHIGNAGQFLPCVGGRLFLDISRFARDLRLRKVLLAALSSIDPGARHALARLMSEGRFAPTSAPQRPPRRRRPLVGMFKGLFGILKTSYDARNILRRTLAALLQPEKARASACTAADAFLDEIKEHTSQSSDLASSLTALEADMTNMPSRLTAHLVPASMPAMFIIGVVDRWLVNWIGLAPGAALGLMRGLPDNITTEMNLKLWTLAQTIRSDTQARQMVLTTPAQTVAEEYSQQKLPPAIQQGLAEFFDEYGMRGFAELDIGSPRWCENPALVLQMLQNYLQLEDLSLAPDLVFQHGAAEAKRLRSECLARLRRRPFGWVRAALLNAAIRRMQVLGVMRELPKSYSNNILALYRPVLLGHGRALVASGLLQAADDIFFVPVDQLRRFAGGELLDLKAIVAEQREAHNRELKRKQVPRLLLSTGELFYGGLGEEGSSDLIGNVASPGVAEGPVRVVLDPRGIRLEPGDILVCRSTDPGWTPLFLTAGGLVLEMGGLVSHGSMVAREYGIPAVVGVRQATERLKNGQRVRVDGSAGRVTVLN